MSLPRSLSLFGAVMLVVGNVVGAGIFTTSGLLAAEIQHPLAFLAVWTLGGFLTLCGALTYAELGAMFPRAGGDYQFLKEAYGPLAGFLIGWLSFWIISPGSIAALSIAIVAYLPLAPSVPGPVWAALIIVVLSLVNLRSTHLASSTQTVITVGSLLLLAGLVAGGFAAGAGSLSHFDADVSQSFSIPGSAMVAVLFTYSGWFAAAYLGSEVKNPGRNVPLALLIGTVIVAILYVAINATYLYALPLREMQGKAAKRAVTLVVDAGPCDAPYMATVYKGKRVVGEVTSGGWGFRTGQSLALAMIKKHVITAGMPLEVDIYGERYTAVIQTHRAVWDPANDRIKA